MWLPHQSTPLNVEAPTTQNVLIKRPLMAQATVHIYDYRDIKIPSDTTSPKGSKMPRKKGYVPAKRPGTAAEKAARTETIKKFRSGYKIGYVKQEDREYEPPKDKGYKRPEDRALPYVHRSYVEAIRDYLIIHYKSQRPPDATAGVLALIIELHQFNPPRPFPIRERAAEAANCSRWGVDAALSVAMRRGLITQSVELMESTRKDSRIWRQRFYVPSDVLLEIVEERKRA